MKNDLAKTRPLAPAEERPESDRFDVQERARTRQAAAPGSGVENAGEGEASPSGPDRPTAVAHGEVFFDRVTHDLRGELATILAATHFLLRYEAGLGPAAKSMLDRVRGAARRLERLLDELGHAAWLARPPRPLSIERCSLAKVCAVARGAEAAYAATRSVTIVGDVGDVEIAADPALLALALRFVLDLSVVRSHGAEVAITAGLEQGRAVVRVRDAAGPVGAGIEHLFEPFAEKSVLGGEEGARRKRLGLGLAIASAIVAAHGGTMEARDTADGLELVVTLEAGLGEGR